MTLKIKVKDIDEYVLGGVETTKCYKHTYKM